MFGEGVDSYLTGLGIGFIPEDVTNLGRIDLTITTPDMSQVYIIAFKVVDNKNQNGKALEQIRRIIERKKDSIKDKLKYEKKLFQLYLKGDLKFDKDIQMVIDNMSVLRD